MVRFMMMAAGLVLVAGCEEGDVDAAASPEAEASPAPDIVDDWALRQLDATVFVADEVQEESGRDVQGVLEVDAALGVDLAYTFEIQDEGFSLDLAGLSIDEDEGHFLFEIDGAIQGSGDQEIALEGLMLCAVSLDDADQLDCFAELEGESDEPLVVQFEMLLARQ